METVRRFFGPPDSSFFLFGPRGTGKSTLIRASWPDALVFDLLDPRLCRRLAARPEELAQRIRGAAPVSVVVIDEVQRVPELLSVVHSLIEERLVRTFVLTGSSARKLKRTGVDLLAGRALLHSLHPFMAAELGDRFSLEAALELGLLPVVLDDLHPKPVLDAYADLYLREEVQMEALVRNVGNFARFLEAISFSHASVLSISNVARECEVERKVVQRYVQIVEDLLLGYRLSVFTKRAKRALTAHPKFYLFDAGVYRALRPRGPLDRPSEIDGQALEGLVGQHLRAWIAYSGNDCKLHFWRTRSGVEVDFVLYGGDAFACVEVKNASRVRPEDIRPLRAFREDYPGCLAYLLYRGEERLLIDGILCMPCEEFLLNLRPGEPLPR